MLLMHLGNNIIKPRQFSKLIIIVDVLRDKELNRNVLLEKVKHTSIVNE